MHLLGGWVSSRKRQPVKSVNCNRRMVGRQGPENRNSIDNPPNGVILRHHENTRLEKSIQQTLLRTFSGAGGVGSVRASYILFPVSFDVTEI